MTGSRFISLIGIARRSDSGVYVQSLGASRWFSGGEWQQFAVLGGILITLGVIRVVAVRYSPISGASTQSTNQMVLSFS